MMRSTQRNYSITVGHKALIVVCAVICCSCSRESEEVEVQAANAEEQVVPVARVRRADIATRTVLTAEFESFQEIDVMAKVAGYVRSIKVDLGDRVREGQLLAVLEVPEMQDDLARAAATIDQSDAEVDAARDELLRSESAHHIAHLSFQRIQDVSKREPGLVPQQEVDDAQSRDLVAEAQISAARSKLQAAQRRTQVAKADQSRVRTMHNYVSIAAPFCGHHHKTVRQHRLDDSGWHCVPVSGHAPCQTVAGQRASAQFAGSGVDGFCRPRRRSRGG